MTPASRRRLLAGFLATGLLAGCAQPRPAPDGSADAWSGRLALQVEDEASQSFSAGFELKGRPTQGELVLLNPLGNVIATLQWSPGRAVLTTAKAQRESASLEDLVRELTGSDIPVAALFGWLRGDAVQATGWEADLSALDQGRLVAQRYTPPPQATLRIALDR